MNTRANLLQELDRIVAPPKMLKPYVERFVREIVVGGEAVFVPCHPLHDAPYNECFMLVEAQVAMFGGEAVFGWAIWEFPKVMIEAEFHAVWRTPDGELVDVSPRPALPKRILFVEDTKRVYPGREVDNIRKLLTKDKDIHRFIILATERFRLMNQGKAQIQSGKIEMTAETENAIRRNFNESNALFMKIMRRYR